MPPANFKRTENEREAAGGSCCGGRSEEMPREREEEEEEEEEEGGVFVRDTARTSPWSHMVVEKVLYGCVCLSVQFRIFTGKRCRPAVCNNRSPSLLFYYPHRLSLSVFLPLRFRCYHRKSAGGCQCD